MKRRIPVASAICSKNAEKHPTKNPNAVTIEGVSSYSTHTVSGAENYKPSHKPIFRVPMKRWSNTPISEVSSKIVDAFGMNKNYIDHFKSPFKD